ncbi:hypothetical protein GLOIN_2v1639358 [Rhizophagus clarus]|uniref:Uncharacterized protein n=1 Tax=Rhizophagus clarus TaxID=94130 RepID=A0A8H3KYX7_9GLOM|nr:hypothetical protein GLOIN_2v1639358 [Rhizophagus clarus]
MSREEDVERIPLLRGAYHNINHIPNRNNNRHSYINYLGLKSDNWIGFNKFDYVIETTSNSDPIFSTNFTEDSTSADRSKIAEIIAKNYKAWNPAYYEVREGRNNPHNNHTILTTQSHMSGLWFIIWPPKVHISFSSIGVDDNKKNNDGGRKTKFIRDDDQDRLLECDYEIRWNYKYFGEIYRKCPNQKKWVNIAYVKGSSEWGMQWLDPERIETYGIVTKPSHGRQMRNVVVRPDSPFPPILPALFYSFFLTLLKSRNKLYQNVNV